MYHPSTTFRMAIKKNKKMGRPPLPKGEVRNQFPMRLSEDERAAVEAAAQKAGQPVTTWARGVLMAAAR
jgi:hypothetical protein